MILLLTGWVTLVSTRPAYTFSLTKTRDKSVSLAVRNGSRAPVELWSAGFWPNHRLALTAVTGKQVALTSFGRAGYRRFEDPSRDKNSRVVLGPGPSHAYRTPPLDKVYVLRPGSYNLRVLYRDTSHGKPLQLSCKGIRIEVTK